VVSNQNFIAQRSQPTTSQKRDKQIPSPGFCIGKRLRKEESTKNIHQHQLGPTITPPHVFLTLQVVFVGFFDLNWLVLTTPTLLLICSAFEFG